jgi:glucose-6-phosphate 1-epimerase
MAVRWGVTVRNGLEVVEVETPASAAAVALHGAQVLSFVPRGDEDWLWVSERARWAPAAALRGGIPLCFPWFGPHPGRPDFPAHGFARTRPWRLEGACEAGADVQLRLALASDGETLALFPRAFEARLVITIGAGLSLSLEVANPGPSAFTCELALHSYFAVSDLSAVSLEGLAGCEYVDKVAGGDRRRERDQALRFAGEVDRVYDSAGPVTLIDSAARRRLRIAGTGAGSTVVWNPAPGKAAKLSDLAPGAHRRFVCVETAAVGERSLAVPAGGARTLSAAITRC